MSRPKDRALMIGAGAGLGILAGLALIDLIALITRSLA